MFTTTYHVIKEINGIRHERVCKDRFDDIDKRQNWSKFYIDIIKKNPDIKEIEERGICKKNASMYIYM